MDPFPKPRIGGFLQFAQHRFEFGLIAAEQFGHGQRGGLVALVIEQS